MGEGTNCPMKALLCRMLRFLPLVLQEEMGLRTAAPNSLWFKALGLAKKATDETKIDNLCICSISPMLAEGAKYW